MPADFKDERVQAMLARVARTAGNTLPLTREWSGIMREGVRDNFLEAPAYDSEGGPQNWPRLKPATIKDRKRKGFTSAQHRILTRTGELEQSIVQDATEDEAKVSTSRVYAAYQHSMRPFMTLGEKWVEKILRAGEKWLARGVRGG